MLKHCRVFYLLVRKLYHASALCYLPQAKLEHWDQLPK